MKLIIIHLEVMGVTLSMLIVMIMSEVALSKLTKILPMLELLELLEVTIMVTRATITMKEFQKITQALVSSPTMGKAAGRRIEEHSLQLRELTLAPACSRRLPGALFNWLLCF